VEDVQRLLEPAAGTADTEPATPDEIMVCWLASQFSDDSICSAGAVSPLAVTSYLLAKKTHAPAMTIITSGGAFVDIAARPALLALADPLDYGTSVLHAGGNDTYHLYYQQGFVTHEVVTAAQIDQYAQTNNIAVVSPSGRRIRLPGQGGMGDVANLHVNFLLYLTRHSPLSLVEKVEFSSAARAILTPEERSRCGLKPGKVELVTDLCVFELDQDTRTLVVASVHPHVTLDQVEKQTGFRVKVSRSLRETPMPTPEQLRVLRDEVDPLGLRRLEFVPSRERAALLRDIIAWEEHLIERTAAVST
jgi:glutaconate CoA-transferase subunit A